MHINGLVVVTMTKVVLASSPENGRIIDELSASGRRSSKPCEGFSQARGFFP